MRAQSGQRTRGERREHHHHDNDCQLPDLHAYIEAQKSARKATSRQIQINERRGKPQAVDRSEDRRQRDASTSGACRLALPKKITEGKEHNPTNSRRSCPVAHGHRRVSPAQHKGRYQSSYQNSYGDCLSGNYDGKTSLIMFNKYGAAVRPQASQQDEYRLWMS